MPVKLPFFILLITLSFGSVNAVLFTPALPDIVQFFGVGNDAGKLSISFFLVGYALGQLIYGPFANRYGRKPALAFGIGLQVISSMLCVYSGEIHTFWLLIAARFTLALGSGVGLNMVFTLVNECYEPKKASQTLSYLMLAFAITPGLSVVAGGFLTAYWGWTSCFYVGSLYGLSLLILIRYIPETLKNPERNALNPSRLLHVYRIQFKNKELILGGLLMGCATCFVYLFAAEAPFIAVNFFKMSQAKYGMANCLPAVGLISGFLTNAKLLSKDASFDALIKIGLVITSVGVIIMFVALQADASVFPALFFPIIIINFGLSFIFSNASVLALGYVTDKANASAVMSFINIGLATVVVLFLGAFPSSNAIFAGAYLALCVAMVSIVTLVERTKRFKNLPRF